MCLREKKVIVTDLAGNQMIPWSYRMQLLLSVIFAHLFKMHYRGNFETPCVKSWTAQTWDQNRDWFIPKQTKLLQVYNIKPKAIFSPHEMMDIFISYPKAITVHLSFPKCLKLALINFVIFPPLHYDRIYFYRKLFML